MNAVTFLKLKTCKITDSGMYLHTELLNSRISSPSLAHPLNPPKDTERSRSPPTATSAYLVLSFFSLLRAKERERERGKNDSPRSNKTEEQWRHWIAKYQVWIRSSASLGLPSSVLLNYVLLTVSSHVDIVVVFAGKLSGSAWSNCL